MANQVMERLLRRGPMVADAAPPPAMRLIKTSITRTAQRTLGLSVQIEDLTDVTCDLDELGDYLSDDQLLLSLDRAGDSAGVLACDRGLVAAALDCLTMGRVNPQPPPDRAITATDVVLIRPFLTTLIGDLAAATTGSDLDGWCPDVTVSDRFDTVRSIVFALPEKSYRLLRLTLSDHVTDRRPVLVIALPGLTAQVHAADAASASNADWSRALDRAVKAAPARLDTVLTTVPMTLARLTSLSVGDTITLPGNATGKVKLIAPDGRLVAKGQLGQLSGQIAVRVEWNDVAPTMTPVQIQKPSLPRTADAPSIPDRLNQPDDGKLVDG